MTQLSATGGNRLLQKLSPGDLARLQPHLETLDLPLRMVMEAAGKPIEYQYFIDDGIASVVARSSNDKQIEVGLIGRDGVTGLAVVLGSDRTPNETFIQVKGRGQRIAVAHMRTAMAESDTLHKLLLAYVQAFLLQTAHTALANGQARIEQRLARWLLMVDDRIEARDMVLTHEFMALMLGVRRPGVTDTLHALEGRGLIRSMRGVVRITDRPGLEEAADGFYGVPEREYERLMG